METVVITDKAHNLLESSKQDDNMTHSDVIMCMDRLIERLIKKNAMDGIIIDEFKKIKDLAKRKKELVENHGFPAKLKFDMGNREIESAEEKTSRAVVVDLYPDEEESFMHKEVNLCTREDWADIVTDFWNMI
jgi:hypothetical protein